VSSVSSALSASGAGGMLGGSRTAYFAMCITFFVDENHVAQLPPKPLPIGHTAAFLFGSSLSHSCHTAHAHHYVIKSLPVFPLLPATVSSAQHMAFKKIRKNQKELGFNCNQVLSQSG